MEGCHCGGRETPAFGRGLDDLETGLDVDMGP
jgi:hypothetical protein